MLSSRVVLRGLQLAAFASLLAAPACGKSTEAEDEPSTVSIRLTFGNATPVTFGPSGGSVHIPVGTTSVKAEWLTAAGTIDPVATTANFTLRVTPSATSITYAPSGSGNTFQGTLSVPAAVSNVKVDFALFHVAEGHEDFGPATITISAP
jgi:hypothetical protein